MSITTSAPTAPPFTSLNGEVLRYIRAKELRLSAEQFAKLLGVHPNTLTRWENGRAAIPRSTVLIVRLLTEEVNAEALLKWAVS